MGFNKSNENSVISYIKELYIYIYDIYTYMTCLFIHPLMDTWVVSCLGYYENNIAMNMGMQTSFELVF